MKIRPEQEKKWEAMWKKWEKPLPQNSSDDIFDDMEAAVPNWKKTVHDELYGKIGAVDSADFENAIETVLDGEDPKSKKKFWDNCVTFDRFLDTVRYVVENGLHKFSESNEVEKMNETSFDQLDWKNGSLTGNGLKQAVDMFKAQNADKQTVVIYDRKSGKIFNIVDVHFGNIKSGHGLEIDIDTSKEISEKSALNKNESDSMKDNKKVNEASDTFDWASDGYGKGNSETYTWKVLKKIFPNLQFSMVSQQGPGSGWPKITVSGKDRDVNRFMKWWNSVPSKDNKFWKKIITALEKIYGKPLYDESELNEADDNDPLSHALDTVGVKASTANNKSQDEVQMTATDGDTYAGIDVAIDRDIDAAMEEIYN